MTLQISGNLCYRTGNRLSPNKNQYKTRFNMNTRERNPNKFLEKLSPSTNALLGRDKETIQKDFINHLEFTQAKDRYSATKDDL